MPINKTNKPEAKVGDNLKMLTEHHSISCMKLAAATGITHSYLSKLLKNQYTNPSLKILKKITRFFKISVAQLLGEQEIDFKNRPKNLKLDFDEE